jgi:hypothetical protein
MSPPRIPTYQELASSHAVCNEPLAARLSIINDLSFNAPTSLTNTSSVLPEPTIVKEPFNALLELDCDAM